MCVIDQFLIKVSLVGMNTIVLFVCSNSKPCMGPVNLIYQHRLPIQVVRLDTPEARTLAANGKYFQIVNVPSMSVIYEDGNTQLFVGADKIIKWISLNFLSRREGNDGMGNMYSRENTKPSSPPIQTPYINPPRKTIIYDDSDQEDDEIIEIKKPKSPKKKQQIIEMDSSDEADFEGGYSEIPSNYDENETLLSNPDPRSEVEEYILEPEEDVPTPKAKTRTKRSKEAKGKKSKVESKKDGVKKAESKRVDFKKQNNMQSIIDKAKQLEKERTDSLGYED